MLGIVRFCYGQGTRGQDILINQRPRPIAYQSRKNRKAISQNGCKSQRLSRPSSQIANPRHNETNDNQRNDKPQKIPKDPIESGQYLGKGLWEIGTDYDTENNGDNYAGKQTYFFHGLLFLK